MEEVANCRLNLVDSTVQRGKPLYEYLGGSRSCMTAEEGLKDTGISPTTKAQLGHLIYFMFLLVMAFDIRAQKGVIALVDATWMVRSKGR